MAFTWLIILIRKIIFLQIWLLKCCKKCCKFMWYGNIFSFNQNNFVFNKIYFHLYHIFFFMTSNIFLFNQNKFVFSKKYFCHIYVFFIKLKYIFIIWIFIEYFFWWAYLVFFLHFQKEFYFQYIKWTTAWGCEKAAKKNIRILCYKS